MINKKNIYIILFFILSFFDFMGIFTQIFPFIRFEDFIYLLKFSLISSSTYQFFTIVFFILIIFQIYVIKRVCIKSNKLELLILFNILIAITGCQSFLLEKDGSDFKFWKPAKQYLVASKTINYFVSRNTLFAKNYQENGVALREYSGDRANNNINSYIDEKSKILLIVNESWGVTKNKEIHENIISPITKLSIIHKVKNSSIKFDGFTLNGELRELCGMVALHFNLKNENQGFENCVPHKFVASGYHTTAVHGALGLMYDRKDWYPRAGFQTTLFRDQGLNLPDSRCYSFPGNCDQDIAKRIIQQFEQHDKLFLYWLTLNTHAIYDNRDLKNDQFDCQVFAILENTQNCRNLKLQKQFFNTLANMISFPAFKGVKVIVVGDHEPPIISKEKSVFMPSNVPILEFEVEH